MECTEGSCPDSDYWNNTNTIATNSSGFTGLPGGYRMSWPVATGLYGNINNFAFIWASDDTPLNFPEGDERLNGRYAYYRFLQVNRNALGGGRLNTDLMRKATGLSVRCILDN